MHPASPLPDPSSSLAVSRARSAPRAPRSRRASLWAGVLAAAFAASPAAGQAFHVRVTDAASGEPVSEALVRVEAADGRLVGAAFAGDDGIVVLQVNDAATYRVRAERVGYTPALVSGVQPGAGPVTVRMARRTLGLDTVTVIARRDNRRERGRDGFERRRAMGEGVYLDPAYVEQRAGRAPFVADLLSGVPGLYLVRPGGRETRARSNRGWRCMATLIDGRPVELGFRDGGSRTLNELIGPRNVIAVEVYREAKEVPPEFQRFTHGGMYRCGAILYWTRAGW